MNATTIEAGWAKREITPAEPVLMGGFGFRSHRSTGVYMPLRVGVLYLRSGGGETCLITLDVVHVEKEDATIFRDRLEAELGLGRDAVILLASHTHTGPMLQDSWPGLTCNQIDEPERRLREQFAETIVQCAREARDSVAPATVEVASGTSDIGINRRGPGGVRLPNPAGITDPVVTALIITKAGEESTPCLVFGYGCHPTTRGGYLLGPDFPGPARLYLEEKHPGLVSFFVQGFEGDVRPRNLDENGRWITHECFLDKVAMFGEQLGRTVDQIYEHAPRTAITGPLRAKQIAVDIPIQREGLEERLAQAERSEKPARQRWARDMRAAIARGGANLRASAPLVMHGFAIGDRFAFLGMGGEICSGYAKPLRDRFPGTHLLLSALTDDNDASYIPTEQILREGGYEAEIFYLKGTAGPYLPGVEHLVHEAGSTLLEELLSATASGAISAEASQTTALHA